MVIASIRYNKDEICLAKVRFMSKMKPSLRAESVGVLGGFNDAWEVEGLVILDICRGRPICIFEVIQDDV